LKLNTSLLPNEETHKIIRFVWDYIDNENLDPYTRWIEGVMLTSAFFPFWGKKKAKQRREKEENIRSKCNSFNALRPSSMEDYTSYSSLVLQLDSLGI